MSNDLLSAAAEAMGAPEAMVQRSAEARAQADGVSVDEVLTAWTGGERLQAAPAAPAEPPAAETPPPAEPEPVVEAPEGPAPASAPTAVAPEVSAEARPTAVAVAEPPLEAAPILVGRRESALALVVGALGLFVVAALFALLLPALDATPDTVPASGLSAAGLRGRDIYVAEGCWYCHTQQVRPIVTDAGLGPVTQSELLASIAPDTLGIQRIGPDLANAGAREPTNDEEWLVEFLANPRDVRPDSLQPGYGHLPAADLADLARYLVESR